MNRIFFFFLFVTVSCSSQTADRNIVLINVETLDRAGVADEIAVINSLNPKVIAVDLQFSNRTEYQNDLRLISELVKCKNLIMVSSIENYTGNDVEYRMFTFGSLPEFSIMAKTGFSNTLHEEDEFKTLARFSTHEKVDGSIEYHFGVRVAMAFDSLKAIHFVERNPRIIEVDYRNGKRKFKTFSAAEVLNRKITRGDIEGKIVIIGFLGPGDEDKFYTPLNTNPNEPDMYGLQYLANIVAQVLESN
jgi:CHASE2 domain-containing sensor protein